MDAVVRARVMGTGIAALCALAIVACGGANADTVSTPSGSAAASGAALGAGSARVVGADWQRFDFDAQRSGVGPPDTGITAGNVGTLTRRRVHLDGTVDSSPVELHAVRVGTRVRDIVFVTTTYGRTIAIDPGTGAKLWEFVPPDIGHYQSTYQITTATPIIDPSRRYLYASDPGGRIHKLAVATGRQVTSGHWPVRVTFLPSREKIASALNISGNSVIVTTGGYIGDTPPYVGHVVMIDRSSGRITAVWNSLCADRHHLLHPTSCPQTLSAIWARSGAVVDPDNGRLLVVTGNAPYNGSTAWGDSVLELSPDARQLLQAWTPSDQAQLEASDADVGSTAPAILPRTGGRRLAVQGGKAGKLDLIDLDRLNGTSHAARRLGGQLQEISAPGGDQVFTAPAVWSHGGHAYVFVADGSGTAVYRLNGGSRPRLSRVASNGTAGTSPIIAGGLLYIFDPSAGAVRVYRPPGLHAVASLPAAGGHWNSPIAVGGRVIVPEGDANSHSTSGTLDIYHLPGH
jgi:outer membrane protein assembly factor BamB